MLVVVRGDHRVNEIKLAQRAAERLPRRRAPEEIARAARAARASSARSAPQMPILLDEARRAAAATWSAPTSPTPTCAASSRAATSPSSASTCATVVAGDTVDGAADPDRAGDRGRQHLQARHALLGAARRDATSTRTGKEQLIWMGSYGFGPARAAAAAVEQFADEHGISWPRAIAPFDVELVGARQARAARSATLAERLYGELASAGLDVLYDDRDAGPGREVRRRRAARLPAAADGRPAHARRRRDRGAGPPRPRGARRCPLEGAAEAIAELWREPALSRRREPITKRRLFGIDRSGPPPPQTRSDQPLQPVDDPERDRLRAPGADPGVPGRRALQRRRRRTRWRRCCSP